MGHCSFYRSSCYIHTCHGGTSTTIINISCLIGVECNLECAIKVKENFNFVSTEYCNWTVTTKKYPSFKKYFSSSYKIHGNRTRGCTQWEVESFFTLEVSVTPKREVRRKREYIWKTENQSTSSENESNFLQIMHYVAQIILH